MSSPASATSADNFSAVPDGTVHWTDAWLAKVPVRHGECVPPFAPVLAPPTFVDLADIGLRERLEPVSKRLRPLVTAFEAAWQQGGAEAVRALPEVQEDAWPKWLLIIFQDDSWGIPEKSDPAGWVFDTALALHGAATVARQVFALHRDAAAAAEHKLPGGKRNSVGYRSVRPHAGLRRLRHAIAALGEADYAAVRNEARTAFSGNNSYDILLVYLLPELLSEWRAMPGYKPHGYYSFNHELECSLDEASAPGGWFDLDDTALAALTWQHGAEVLRACAVNLKREMPSMRRHALIARLLAILHHDDAIAFAVRHASHEAFAGVLAQQLAQWPLRTAEHILCPPADVTASEASHARTLLLNRLFNEPELAARLAEAFAARADGTLAAALAALQPADDSPEAEPATLPEVLRAPPWHAKRRVKLPKLALAPGTPEPRFDAAFLATPPPAPHPHTAGFIQKYARRWGSRMTALEDNTLMLLGVRSERCTALNGGAAMQASDLGYVHDFGYYTEYTLTDVFAVLPTDMQRRLVKEAPFAFWQALKPDAEWLRRLLRQFAAEALPLCQRIGETRPDVALAACMVVDWPLFAPLAASGFTRARARRAAQNWLRAHPASAAHGLLPLVFGGSARANGAMAALRWLAANDHADTIARVASDYGDEAHAAWQTLLATPAWQFYPAKLPTLPLRLAPHTLPAPRLRTDGSRLPRASLGDLALMLAISQPDEAWPGLQEVMAACTPESLARFGEALLVAWDEQGHSKKDDWMLRHQPLLADAHSVRTLARLVRGWSGARAQQGIEILADLGLRAAEAMSADADADTNTTADGEQAARQETAETALLYLATLGRTAPQQKLRSFATERIADIAAELGLTADELADRLVPDLGLDARGSLTLDYGPRQYFVRFDATLAPYVVDADGQRQKSLPRANKLDDAELAAAASARYKALKKDVDTVAKQEIARLEMAMRTQRRWSGEVFERLFAHHPLVRHLAQRLVWGVFDANERLLASFRLAEDLSLLDAADDDFALAPAARLGIAHPLELGPERIAAWQALFSDYAIVQPFEQLQRATFAPDAGERAERAITRFANRPVPATSLGGLRHRGWLSDGGGEWVQAFTGAHGLVMALDPGFELAYLQDADPQRIVRIFNPGADGNPRLLEDLPAIALSEALRDATLMRAAG